MFGNTVKQNEGQKKRPTSLSLTDNLCWYFDVIYWFVLNEWIPGHSSDNPTVKAFIK